MLTRDFDFELPPELIAQHPVEPRDRARLMVVYRGSRSIAHRTFADLPELLRGGDVLVRNNTRVVPARLVGRREATGGRWEGLYLRTAPDLAWELLARTRGRPKLGESVVLDGGLRLQLVGRGDGGTWRARPECHGDALALLERFGKVPLPPYIRNGQEEAGDRARYQTTFAAVPGSVAAPTAGLHFTPEVFDRLRARGVGIEDLTLHVGLGTFRPIEAERIEDHVLHAEWAELPGSVADQLNGARARGGRIVAVGTTAARTLETAARQDRALAPWSGPTQLYIQPGHAFRGLDALITNFHLPRSSLLVLVSALAGRELIRDAYTQAIAEGYRFYSYGDAMLVLDGIATPEASRRVRAVRRGAAWVASFPPAQSAAGTESSGGVRAGPRPMQSRDTWPRDGETRMGLDDRVLVVPARELDRLGRFQGFTDDVDRYLDALLAPGLGEFRPRRDVEDDPSLKQIIPYVVFRAGDLVFCYTRGTQQGEGRLHRLRSLGVGGHVDEADAEGRATLDAYEMALRRELDEEVAVAAPGQLRRVGLINDDATPVGRVHLGVVHLFELERPEVTPREDGLAEAGFAPVSELRGRRGQFETWSQICLDSFLAEAPG